MAKCIDCGDTLLHFYEVENGNLCKNCGPGSAKQQLAGVPALVPGEHSQQVANPIPVTTANTAFIKSAASFDFSLFLNVVEAGNINNIMKQLSANPKDDKFRTELKEEINKCIDRIFNEA